MTARKKTNRFSKSPSARKRRLARKQSSALSFEALESRQLLAAITVSNATDILSPTADTSSIAALVANDGGDGISLREAIAAADNTVGEDALTFDVSVFAGGDNNLIRLTQGELWIRESLSIDSSSVGGVVITGDADGDDITFPGTNITDVETSSGGTANAPDLLDDNSRVLTTSGPGDVTLTGLTITGGGGGNGGGIFASSSVGTLTLNQSIVSGNHGSSGGGIAAVGGVFLNDSTVSMNAGGNGGGIYGLYADFFLSNSVVSDNSASGSGAGIHVSAGSVTLANSTVSGNSAGSHGGGISSSRRGDISLTNSTVSGNLSGEYGGGISSSNSTVLLNNSTVSGNSAYRAGGGISNQFRDELLTLQNSIVASNSDNGTAPDILVGDAMTDLIVEFSLIGDTTGSGITETTGFGNILDRSPLLGPLADNGGPTETHALLVGSLAANAGSNAFVNASGLVTDQRGEDRIQLGTVDMGAFEFDFEATGLVVTTDQDVVNPVDGVTSLREAIAFSNEQAMIDSIVFDPNLFSVQTTIYVSSQLPTIAGELTILGPGANLLTIDAQRGGDNVLNGNGFRIFEVDDGNVSNSSVTISGLTLTGGDTSDSGGAINNLEILDLANVEIIGNFASIGGGVSNDASGILTVTSSTIANNQASQDGGGIFNGGELTATQVTISGNSAVNNGAAILTAGDSPGATLNLTSSTIANNTGNEGVYFNSDNGPTTATFNNSIFDNSITGVGNNGSTLAGSNNLFASADPGITGTGNLFSETAMLGPLADNGGSTLTHSLIVPSPAINAGNNLLAVDENGLALTVDQRGERRIEFDTVDIGAVEVEFEETRSLIVNLTLDVEDPFDGLTSLREAIGFANDPTAGVNSDGDADGDGLSADTITFDSSIFTGGDNSMIRLTQGELRISDSLAIDGASVGGVLITGDANGDDVTVAGTNITDVLASGGLNDNSRVLNFLTGTGDLSLSGLTITGGRVSEYSEDGGGVQFNSVGTLTLNETVVSGNNAVRSDGGGIFTTAGNVSLSNSTVSNNIIGRSGSGGGISTTTGDVSLINSTVNGNSTSNYGSGGGIFTTTGDVSLINSTVSGNSATGNRGSGNDGDGGGILTGSGNVTLTRSTVSDNSATGVSGDGGGIRTSSGNITLNSSTVSGNISRGNGGGIHNGFGDLISTNSTVSGNSSGGGGGGAWIYRASFSTVMLVSSTVTGNSASEIGGGIGFEDIPFLLNLGSLTVQNSILAGNTDNGTAPDLDSVGGGAVNDLIVEYSLIGDTTGAGINAAIGVGNILNQSPLLGPLADNGGPTQTHALIAGSPALNAGSNTIAGSLTTDQRGEDRIESGTVDIGAFEVNDLLVFVTQLADENDPLDLDINTANFNDLSLREAIALANATPIISSIAFDFPGPVGVAQVIAVQSQLTISSSVTIEGLGANLLTIDAQGGGDNVLDGDGFGIFEINDGDSSSSSEVSISGLTLTGSDNSGSGGAVNNSENLTLDGVEIIGNRARLGGGVSNELSGELTISNSTIANNIADEDGGGISTRGALTATQVTISGNSAGSGGGIFAAGGSSGTTLDLTHLTLSNNNGYGGVHFDSGDGPTIATFNNSIIDGTVTGVGNYGTSLSGAYNLFASDDPGIVGIGNLFSQSSMLSPLTDNGGSTSTHVLLFASPAIDAGSNALALDENGNQLTTDQRGQDRVKFGTVDIGAVEFEEVRSLIVTTTQDVEDPLDGVTSLREAIAFANDPTAGVNSDGDADGDGLIADTITFDASVFTGGENSLIRLTQGQLSINNSLTIDGGSAGGVVITGDADGDDVTFPGTHITDVAASFGGTAGTPDDLLDDNSQVLVFFSFLGDLNLNGLTITGGRAQFDGGGISSRGNVSLINSTVSGNLAEDDGGGINSFRGNLTLTNSTVSRNSAVGDGGGIGSISADRMLLTNSTVSGNSSGGDAGGIWSDNSVELINSTVTGNSAAGVGGGFGFRAGSFFQNESLTLYNSIVTGNVDNGTAPDVEAVSNVANYLIVEHSLIGDTTGSGITAATGAGNILDQPALLGPLADNGGPTLTHNLLLGSPAIDAGNSLLALDENGNLLTADQRGSDRIQTAVIDIGAVEADSENQSLVVTTSQDVTNPFDGVTSLREAVAVANDPTGGSTDDGDADGDGQVADTITFAPSVFTGGSSSVIRLTQGELLISERLSIDGSSVGGVVVTGDANGDDITFSGTDITDVSASFGGTAGASSDLLDDNSRVLNLLDSGNLNLTGLTITGGRAPDAGGGITSSYASVSLTNSTVSGNSSHGAGGGIRTISGDVTLANSTVSQNSSVFSGGGIFTGSGDVTLTNSTLSGNNSASDGGGIWFDDATILLVNSTVTGNSAAGMGGGIGLFADNFNDDERLTIHNSIVAGNTDNGTAPDLLAVGDVTSDLRVEYSLIGNTTGSGITLTTGTGNILNQSALLGPLADNGSSTLTHALLPGSPAIDVGSNALAVDENGNQLTVDQRGEARIESGTVDIGAVELGFDDPFLLGDANQDGNVNFLDISPFISLLSNSTFLNEADINRDGRVNFLDISPFVSLLASGGSAQSNFSSLATNSVASPAIAGGSVVASQVVIVESPIRSTVSVSPPASIISALSTVEVPITPTSSLAKNRITEPLPSKDSKRQDATTSLPQASFLSPSEFLPIPRTTESLALDSAAVEATPVDNFKDEAVLAPIDDDPLTARDSSTRSSESSGPLVTPRSLTWNMDSGDLPRKSRDEHPAVDASIEEYFSTAAELFDAHPDLLNEIFDFQLEEILSGPIE